ncbi:MAG: hypothetical protein AB8B87_20225 [Granulosicoccus sp.]
MNRFLLRIITSGLVLSITGCGSDSLRLIEIVESRADSPDLVITMQYTDEGNRLSETRSREGTAIRIDTYKTTPAGLLVSRSTDDDLDGRVPVYDRQYEYNESGALFRFNRFNGSGRISSVVIYEFQDGLATSSELINTFDVSRPELVDITSGTKERLETYEYEEGRIIAINRDSNLNGTFDFRTNYTYNPNGTLASTSVNSITNGVIRTSTYVYEDGLCKPWGDTTVDFYCIKPE